MSLYRVVHWFTGLITRTRWQSVRTFFTGRKSGLTDLQLDELRLLLAQDYYVILTFSKAHLSNWLIAILSWITTGKAAKYAHALMNVDGETDPSLSDRFRLIEATRKGVDFATFDEVFACDRVCLLSPVNMSKPEWTAVIDKMVQNKGKPYDDLFDLLDDRRMSCVELVIDGFKEMPRYATAFVNLEAEIKRVGNLTPQMFRDSPDLMVDYEAGK
jgi:hypothetical protein